jgi:hypothetical protein
MALQEFDAPSVHEQIVAEGVEPPTVELVG